MKILKRLIIAMVVFLVLLFVCVSVYIRFYGKDMLESALTGSLERQVTFEKISYRFPLGLRAKNILIAKSLEGGQFFEAKSIIARLSLDAIFQGKLIFDSVILVKPFVAIEKINESQDAADDPLRRYGLVVPPAQPESPATEIAKTAKNDEDKKQSDVSIKRLILRQGRVQYKNTSIDKDFSVALEGVYLKCKQLNFPLLAGRTDFNIRGRLVKEGNPLSGSVVEGSGWVDIIRRDMEAVIEVVEADGSVGMTAKAESKNNDMKVTGEIKFQNILMGAKGGGSSEASSINDLISSALSSAGVQIGAQFSFNTKMDNFRPEQVSFTGNVLTR